MEKPDQVCTTCGTACGACYARQMDKNKCLACGNLGVIPSHSPHEPDEIISCPDCRYGATVDLKVWERRKKENRCPWCGGTIHNYVCVSSSEEPPAIKAKDIICHWLNEFMDGVFVSDIDENHIDDLIKRLNF